MKARILSFVIAFIALLSFSNAEAQNAHFVKGPCINDRTISATIAGLGSGPVEVRVTGQYDCINPGGNRPPSWQDFDVSRTFDKRTGGNFKLTYSLSGLCPNKNWNFETQNVNIYIYQDGIEVLKYENVPDC